MKITICQFFCLFIISILPNLSYSQQSVLNFNLEPGPYTVGFKAVNQYDYSRSFAKYDVEGKLVNETGARPVQTSIWYPSVKDESASFMVFEEYVCLIVNETHFADCTDEALAIAKERLKTFTGSPDERFGKEMKVRTNAIKNAKPAKGSFPVIIYAPSWNSSSFENSVLCEYLASHGYIVVSTPCMGMNSHEMTEDIVGIETQALDIGFLISYINTLPNADVNKIAVAGYSWGGISNIFAKMRNDNIKALICLDGSIRYFPQYFKDSPFADFSRIDVPLLYLSQMNRSLESLSNLSMGNAITNNFYDSLKYSDAYLFIFNELVHQNFSSLFIMLMDRNHERERDQKTVNENYELVNTYVLNFLNAYLKHDKAALAYMQNSPEQNGIKPFRLTKQFKKAQDKPPTMMEFSNILNNRGFDKAYESYEEIKTGIPDFELKEAEINNWGYELLARKKFSKAIDVFKLNAKLYPESFNVWDSLGDGYRATGDKKQAIKNYQKSIEINPKNLEGIRKMNELIE